MIAILVNADTRPGQDADVSTVGDSGEGSLHGARSWDMLTDGVEQKRRFFDGYDCHLTLYVDRHVPIPNVVESRLNELIGQGVINNLVVSSHERTLKRWNDYIYTDALKTVPKDAKYIAHFDQDANAMRRDDCDIVERYMRWLDEGMKFVCQQSAIDPEYQDMKHASTRFFICKRETINVKELEYAVQQAAHTGPWDLIEKYQWHGTRHFPCLEHILGIVAGDGGVYYPPREFDNYIIWNWVRYRRGVIRELMDKPYEQAAQYLIDCGIFGAEDVLAK